VPAIEVPERIEGQRCALRPLTAADLEAYGRAFVDDPDLAAKIGIEGAPDQTRLAERPQMLAEAAADGDFIELVIADPVDDRMLGAVTLHSIAWRHERAEVGFWLVPAERGAGIGTEATALCVEWAFARLNMHRVEMTTLPSLAAVLAIAKRLGFRHEGVMRERDFENGERLDVVMLAVLQEEWAFPLNQ
jgi:[ribosomal protein S5]-alanine N-acetyltransferase